MTFSSAVTGVLGGITIVVGGALTFIADFSLPPSAPASTPRADEADAKTAYRLSGPSRETSVTSEDLSAEQTLQRKLEFLERGRSFLRSIPGYTAQFSKQEVVGGELLEEQIIFLKCRHQPFSVYLLWETGDAGREVLYVEGANLGRLLVHDGGWKSRLPALSLTPDCAWALHDSRYPVTSAGLLGLIEIMVRTHRDDLSHSNFAACELHTDSDVAGRPCLEFVTRYKNSEVSPKYRKSITRIDEEWNVPLESQHFEWPRDRADRTPDELDPATLIEWYRFTDIDFGYRPEELDFDRANPAYRFR